jgi:tetratricopeptide (TPR) repeat protein
VHLTQVEVSRLTEIDNLGGIGHLPPAEFLELKGLRTQAESSFLESLRLNPAEPGALFGLGWLYYRRREFPHAIARYTAIIDATPTLIPADRKKYLADAYQKRAN